VIRIPEPISFEWDDGNRDKNWIKHGVSNIEAEEVFFDPNKRLFRDVLHSMEEDRYILLGKTLNNRLLFVVFTIRGDTVRVISARDVK